MQQWESQESMDINHLQCPCWGPKSDKVTLEVTLKAGVSSNDILLSAHSWKFLIPAQLAS